MKGGREHVIPLSPAAVAAFERAKAIRTYDGDLVFQGQKRGKPISDMTLSKLIRDMHSAAVKEGRAGYLDPIQGKIATPHGFRSSFKDWASETTGFTNELSEAALAHAIANKTEAAYRRGSLLDKRRAMMAAWGDYCEGASGGNVVRLAR